MERMRELIDSEEKARKFLSRCCWQKQRRFCPRCQKNHPYRLADGRLRCRSCGYTFHDFTGRWLNRGNLSAGQWLKLIELFEKEISTRQIASRLKLSYNTAYRAVTTIRLAIIANSPGANFWIDLENELLPHLTGDKVVFGVRQQGDAIDVVPLPALTPAKLLAGELRMVRRGRIVVTDRYADCTSLIFFFAGDEAHRFSRIGIPSGQADFWRFLKDRINKKVTRQKFPLFLKEMEFRYNQRGKEMRTALLQLLCAFEKELQEPADGEGASERPAGDGILPFEAGCGISQPCAETAGKLAAMEHVR